MGGGLVTAVVAGRAPLPHTLALAALMLVMGIVSFFQSSGGQQPKWYALTLMLLLPLCAVLGGYLQSLRHAH